MLGTFQAFFCALIQYGDRFFNQVIGTKLDIEEMCGYKSKEWFKKKRICYEV